MFTNKAKPPLIIDSDQSFLKTLSADPLSKNVKPLIASNGKEAQLILADKKIAIGGIFINSELSPDSGHNCFSVIRFCRQQRSQVPIYVIYDEKCSYTMDKLGNYGVREIIQKPITYTRILEIIAPRAILIEQKNEASLLYKEATGSELNVDDSQFVPIRAGDFVSGAVCNFNLYVQLGSGRYLKLLTAGDSFTPERLQSYLFKGVEHFHLRKEEQEQYLKYCDLISNSITHNKKISTQAKINQALNFGQETFSFLKSHGLSETNLGFATSFVENIHSVIEDIKDDQLKKFMENIVTYEHGVSVSMVSSLIATSSGIESSSLVQIVGIASMLHDIGLSQLPKGLHHEDESMMSEEQKKLFHTHPTLGAEILEKIPGTHPSVIQAVLQHHERRGNKAFSSNHKPKAINRVAEIVGIADDYIKLIKKHGSKDPKLVQELLEKEVFPGFSAPIVEAFKSVYCKIA